jgi:hypothetical protein
MTFGARHCVVLFLVAIPFVSVAGPSAPFIINGQQTTVDEKQMRVIFSLRAKQAFPISFETKVPERLQPLIVDFGVMFTRSQHRDCSEYLVSSVASASDSPSTEIWSLDVCGTIRSYRVDLKPCNNLLNNPLVVVTRQPFDGPTLVGKDPLDATLLVACPDR